MLSPADRIVESTMEYTLRPKRHNREKVIAAALEFVLDEFAYQPALYGNAVVDVADIADLIYQLRDTVTLDPVTLEKPSQGHRRKDLDAL